MAPSPKPPPRSSRNRRHSRNYSTSDLLPPERGQDGPPRRKRRESSRAAPSTIATSNALSADALAKLDALNEKSGWNDYDQNRDRIRNSPRRDGRRRERDVGRDKDWNRERERDRDRDRQNRVSKQDYRRRRDDRDHNHYREKRRVVSGPLLEEGGNYAHYDNRPRRRGGKASEDEDDRARKRRKRRIWIIVVSIIILLIIIIAVAVGVSKNKHSGGSSSSGTDDTGSQPGNTNLRGISPDSIPSAAQGTYLDPFTWYDTTDFNVTYTDETVGGLPIMGLNSTWDNNVRANPSVPPLTESWEYGGQQKVHGMNIGGWLCIEPFITPSFFNRFSTSDGVIDEWTYTKKLGPVAAAQALESHYSSFITEQSFADIASAGFDHVRISYSYWAVTTYDGDPYVPKISFRYLLRGIEWARKHGLRVNLDLHGAPGSQNGWNHSGRQGVIGWLNGTDGTLNAQRTIDIHKQLGAFFSQPRYKNLVTMYGLVNEPKMIALNTADVTTWSQNAIDALHGAGLSEDVVIVIGDGFMGLANWQGSSLSGAGNVLLDAHQYVIFNVAQLVLSHTDKINFACKGWTQQSQQSMDTSTGFGSFLCGEWSQADTDCQTYLNNVGWGNRWTGTLNTGNASQNVLNPTCPTAHDTSQMCDCTSALADPSDYTPEYKTWLKMFAEAQMHSYEVGWGWFYWTWKTEDATQWSYELGMQAGILPTNVRDRDFDCSQDIPDFAGLGLPENY